MGLSALIIGYGSIGKKHAEILNSLEFFSNIYVLTSQKKIPFKSISQIEESLKIDPDYFIISSPTYKHFKQLLFLEKNFKNKKILIEKPLYEKYYNFNPTQNQVWVGYCLRFNPVIEFLKLKLKDKKISNVNVFCGSFLPNWRVKSNYLKSYSASKSKGGGVLLDLSHEIDYINWLFGSFDVDYVFNGKISNLPISSDDTLILNGHFDKISLYSFA